MTVSKVRRKKLAKARIEEKISAAGGYSKEALKSLGVSWPPTKGWKARLIAEEAGLRVPTQPSKRKAKAPKAASFYASWEWKQLRYEAFKAYGRRCQCCGWRPGDTDGGYLVVDHIKPRSKHPKLQLSLSNLQVLCNDCNMGKSNIYEDDFRDEWLEEERDPLTAQFMATMQ